MLKLICSLVLILALFSTTSATSVREKYSDAKWETEYKEMLEKYRYDEYEKLYDHIIMETWAADNPKFKTQSRAMQALHVVMIFDMEVQCGGVAQFFWNCGSAYAALVPEMLRETGFEDMAALYEDFLVENYIQMEEIDSYRERFPDMIGLYDFHPFDSFDQAYMKIWEETNFNNRVLQYTDQHPEIYDKWLKQYSI